jgi:hypothetical protein
MEILPRRFLASAVLFVACSSAPIAQAVPISGQGTWETTLQGRDLDGNVATAEAYYDTILNITWLADANGDGLTTWALANAWATSLDIGGVSGWRLPETSPIDGVSFDYTSKFDGSTDYGYAISAPGTIYAGGTGSELANLFYSTLGNLAFFDTSGGAPQAGWGLTNTGNFSNVQPLNYWSGTDYAPISGHAWDFTFNSGLQFNLVKADGSYAWAVHDGDVGTLIPTIPEPGSFWLFGLGLMGYLSISRHFRSSVT